MRQFRNLALASLAAFAMLAGPETMTAQTRRTTTTTTQRRTNTGTSTSSQTKSSGTQTRSTTSSSQTRGTSTSTQTRQNGNTSSVRRSSGTSSTVRQSSGSTTQNSGTSTSTQTRQNGNTSSVRRSSGTSSTVRQSLGTTTQSSGTSTTTQTRQNGTTSSVRRSSGTSSSVRQSSGTTTQSAGTTTTTKQTTGNSSQIRQNSGTTSSVRRNSNVTKSGLSTVTSQMRTESGSNYRGNSGHASSKMDNSQDFRIEDHNVQRIPPRDRDYMPYDRPGHFYAHKDPHYFGYRVESLPPKYRVERYFGVDYYIYNDVYYRPYSGHYIVCRPPFGITITASIADLAFSSVRFGYYSNVYRQFNTIDENNRYIDQQNRIIAQNNATIMAQNNAIAMNPSAALSSYEIANRLGLVQSYAYANKNYYYQDGIFYIINSNGQYQTIVPPAGALVQSLPDDYGTVTLNGVEYYRVDDTVYRLTLIEGTPYLEVLGQMYGNLARTYNIY